MSRAPASTPGLDAVRREFVFDAGPTEQCHASTLAFVGDTLVAAWFGGRREGAEDVDIWTARRVGGVWSEPQRAAQGRDRQGRRWPCWNPVLHAWSDGHLDLFFKVGPSPRRWWGMRCGSDDAGLRWTAPEHLPDGFLGPIKNKPLHLEDGRLLCGSSRESVGWQVHLEWAPPPRAEATGWAATPALNRGWWLRAIQPTLLQHGQGRIQMLCRTRSGRVAQSWSHDGGRTWERLRLTDLPDAASGIDAVSLGDGRHVLVYNHSRRGRSPLNLAVSEDGHRWSAAAVLESGEGEYSYPAVVQGPSGRVHVAYTWHRRRIRHVEIDVDAIELRPIRSGRWPDGRAG